MAAGAVTATVTAKLGPGLSVSALAFSDVNSINFNFAAGEFEIIQETKTTQFEYSDVSTVTITPSTKVVTIST
jgi:hypothetical protein